MSFGTLQLAHAQVGVLPNFPDTCTSEYTPGPITEVEYPQIGNGAVVRYTAGSLAGKQLVVIVNGNGWVNAGYQELAEHLARNGFITAVVSRPGSGMAGGDGQFVLDSTDEILRHVLISKADQDLQIAFMGHSKGGKHVANAATLDMETNFGLPIRAVVALAPFSDSTTVLSGYAAPSFLAIYGSQDEDVDGYDSSPNEAFRMFDQAGTEETTTCNTPPCAAPIGVADKVMDKTMIYLRGGDHAGLLGYSNGPGVGLVQNTEYVAASDQLCITKAYVTGFLRWKMLGVAVYKGLLRGSWRPASVQAITTSAPDEFGAPAGSALRMDFQIGPTQRKVVQNFETSLGLDYQSPSVQVQLAAAGTFDDAPFFDRHWTQQALVGWSSSGWLRWQVPAGSRMGTGYSHFALRVGQLQDAPPPYDNLTSANQKFWLGFEDGSGQIFWRQFTDLFPPDPDTSNPANAVSNMRTLRVPVASITGINLNDVRYVRMLFSAGTHGTLMVDNLEWHRD